MVRGLVQLVGQSVPVRPLTDDAKDPRTYVSALGSHTSLKGEFVSPQSKKASAPTVA